MTHKFLLISGLAGFTTAACMAADVHPLDVKTGMWESTMTVTMAGLPPIPPEVLAKMTPQQKAMMESRMKGQPGKPTVTKHCLTKEELNKPLDFGSSKRECKRDIVSSSSRKQEFQIHCESSAVKSDGTVKIDAMDAEHVKVTMHMTSGDGPRTMTIDANGTGKWLGSKCEAETDK